MRFCGELGVATRMSMRIYDKLGVAAMMSMRFCGELGVAARCALELIKAHDSSMHSLSWQVRALMSSVCVDATGPRGKIFREPAPFIVN